MANLEETIDNFNRSSVTKCKAPLGKLMLLSVLAGAYISLGAIFFTTLTAFGGHAGAIKLMGGVAFSLGLILVVLAGAELFTGNNLMIIGVLNRKISLSDLCKSWALVFIGNLIGSILFAVLMFSTEFYLQSGGQIGAHAIKIAEYKTGLGFSVAFSRAILCNMLVCLAVWLSSVAKTFSGKVLGIIFPITAFVAIGYEHSVANMYFISIGLILKNMAGAEFWNLLQASSTDFSNLTLQGFFLKNLLPVTLGNIVGGSLFVGTTYWYINRNE